MTAQFGTPEKPFCLEEATIEELHAAIKAGQITCEKVLPSTLGYQRSTWGGNPANPYDTTRSASLGSSSGSGVSVSTNLVMASLGEETRASCRGPANHNAVALILPHKSLLGFGGGAIGADIYCDRSGILCRTIGDCAKVLDALKDPVAGYYDPRDPFTTVPRSSVLSTPYASHAQMPGTPGALMGIRLGIIRESMVCAPGSKAGVPIITAKEQLTQWIDEDREQIIGFLCDFVRAKSPNPPGDTTLAAAHVTRFLEAHQCSPRLRRRRGASLTAPLPRDCAPAHHAEHRRLLCGADAWSPSGAQRPHGRVPLPVTLTGCGRHPGRASGAQSTRRAWLPGTAAPWSLG
jgi:hypothetical protein